MGIDEKDGDSSLEKKEEYCKLESCKEAENFFSKHLRICPFALLLMEREDRSLLSIMTKISTLKKLDVCSRGLSDQIQAISNKRTSNGATSTLVMDTLTTLLIVVAAQYSLL